MIAPPAMLGLIAGGGDAPARLLAALDQLGRDVFVICLEGQAAPGFAAGRPHMWLPLGAGERAVTALRDAGVVDIIFLGHVRRPSLRELKPDLFTLQRLPKLGLGLLGDDGLLRGVAKLFEDEGFRVVAVQDVLATLLTSAGQLGRHPMPEDARADVVRGIAAARALGAEDIGQSVVVQQGIVLAVEAVEGTDAMVARAGTLHRAGVGGVLVKLCKPQQDRRLDLPAWGVKTVQAAVAAGLRGIVVQAGASLMIDRVAVIEAADAAGLFLWGCGAETP